MNHLGFMTHTSQAVYTVQLSRRRAVSKFGATGFPVIAVMEGGGVSHAGDGTCGHWDDCLDELVVRFEQEWQAEDFVR